MNRLDFLLRKVTLLVAAGGMVISSALFATLLQEFSHQRGPTRLVTGADAGTVIAVKIFVEQDQITPLRIVLKFLGTTEHWPRAFAIAQEDTRQPP